MGAILALIFSAFMAQAQFEQCPNLTGLYVDYFGNRTRVEQKLEGPYLIYTAHYAGDAQSKMTVGQNLSLGYGFDSTYCEDGVVVNHSHGAGAVEYRDVNQIYPSNVKDEYAIEQLVQGTRKKKQTLAYIQDVYYKTFLFGQDFETDMANDIVFQNLDTKEIHAFREQTVNRMKRVPTE